MGVQERLSPASSTHHKGEKYREREREMEELKSVYPSLKVNSSDSYNLGLDSRADVLLIINTVR